MATESPAVLLDTKLNPPTVRDTVDRPRLVETLTDSSERLKLVRAPAGWGKTTLVAAWLQSPEEDRTFAWLSLDSWDDDPTRFWLYVIEAVRGISPTVGGASVALLTAPGTSVEADVLPSLINELAELPEHAVLVLDDYHAIRNPEIHSQLSFLLERLPPSLEVVVVTRFEPQLPLGRMRARGELLEIDVDGLRFDEAEAQELLNRVLDLSLAPEDASKLRDRTEGWAAGLYLAALSLRGADDPSSFVDDFAGDDRNVVDYLGAEVLAAQPAHLREVLLRTSILERFCAPLVEAVTGASDGAGLLREIERADLFLVPLDTRREWFRYHHLFQQLLRLELSFTEPDAKPELHRRAAAWHLQAGNIPEGIRNTIAAGDSETAGELIAQHWAPTLLGAAGDRTVDSWLSALGDDAVAADLRLCFARCFIDLSYGDMDGVARWLAIAERAPLPAPFREGLTSPEGALAVVRTAYLWELGDVSGSLAAGHEAFAAEGKGAPWSGIGAATIGLANGALGNFEEGRSWALEYARVGREFGQHLNETSGLGTAAFFDAERGDWSSAEELANRSLKISVEHGISEHWSGASCHLALGLLFEYSGDLGRSQAQLERAAVLDRRGAGPIELGWVLMHLSRVQAARGDRAAALASLDEAAERLRKAPDPGNLIDRLERARRQVSSRARDVAPGEDLSGREIEVLRLLATPMTQREIGDRLYVSVNTVKTHARSIFRKLAVSGRAEAVARARELRLI